MAAAGGGGDTTEDVVKQMKKLQGTLKEVGACARATRTSSVTPSCRLLLLSRERMAAKRCRMTQY
jgi:hypothetical protein